MRYCSLVQHAVSVETIKRIAEIELQCRRRLTENDGHKNDGPSKLHNMKLQGVKLTDQVAGYGIAGQKNRNCSFSLFLNTQRYDALCVNDCLL